MNDREQLQRRAATGQLLTCYGEVLRHGELAFEADDRHKSLPISGRDARIC